MIVLDNKFIAKRILFAAGFYTLKDPENNKINYELGERLIQYMIDAFNSIFKIGAVVGFVVGVLSILIIFIIL